MSGTGWFCDGCGDYRCHDGKESYSVSRRELEEKLRSAQLAAAHAMNDLLAMGLLCGQTEDEYPRKAIERYIGELRDSLKYALGIIDHELPRETCLCNACGDCASQFYLAENLRKARALLSNTNESGEKT